jgi:hypothetical protein
MNRRRFLALTSVGLGAAAVGRLRDRASSKLQGERYEVMTRPLPEGTRLFLDDRDITYEAFACHTGEGWADCFKVERYDARGHPVLMQDNNSSVRERRYGAVEVRRV